jgi:small conductance mechanosensitive channel
MFILFQSTPTPTFSTDTLLTKGTQIVETIRTTPANELMQNTLSAVVKFGLKVLLALLIYIVGAWLIRKTKALIAKGFEKKKSDSTLSTFIQSLVTALLWIVLILAMVGTLGINTTSIAALLAAGGMAIGMAMSGTVQNFAGGIILLAFKPFKVDDYVKIQGFFGRIAEITINHTKLITTDNREIIIPNGTIATDTIDNYSSRTPQRLSIKFNVPYGTDFDQVKDILLEMVKQQPKILTKENPGAKNPKVYLNELNDSSIQIKLRVWIDGKDYKKMTYWLNENIYKELPKHGISFPFPQLDVHLKQN